MMARANISLRISHSLLSIVADYHWRHPSVPFQPLQLCKRVGIIENLDNVPACRDAVVSLAFGVLVPVVADAFGIPVDQARFGSSYCRFRFAAVDIPNPVDV